ncbi:MAG: hypothetical protein JNK04_16550 [Myxococcales bacterium]|nr:hypothetical protein [Myxococcales bacterium]
MRQSLAVAALFLAACGDSGTGGAGGAGGAGDGKFHPPADGVGVDEMAACEDLRGRLTDIGLTLECVTTLPTCPGFVRSVGGADCLQYDAGTIEGCIAYYEEATDCEDLSARADNCAFEPIADSAPNGCPE